MKIGKFELNFDNDITIYIIINIICMLMNFSFLYLVYKQKIFIREQKAIELAAEQAIADSLAQVQLELDAKEALTQTTKDVEKKPKKKKTPFDDIDESKLTDSERELLQLQKMFYALSNPDIDDEEEEEEIIEEPVEEEIIIEPYLEPILVINYDEIMNQRKKEHNTLIDSLKTVINNIQNDNLNLSNQLNNKDKQIVNLNDNKKTLEERIVNLEHEKKELETPPVIEVAEPKNDYRQLARIYNGMDSKKAAKIMQQMPSIESTNILRLMNQRKVTQILAALPPKVATEYSQILSTKRGEL
jgi:flagellar motility protein MotE (MotC chaperone)